MPDELTPEAEHMLDVLDSTAAFEGWVDWRKCVPSASNPSYALMYANELRSRGSKIERRGLREEEAYRLTR